MGSIWSPDALSVRPSFKAKNAANISVTATEIVNYQGESNDSPDYSNGGGWNASTGRYTAQRSGIHHFDGLATFTLAAAVGLLMRINGDANRAELLIQKTTSVGSEYIPFSLDIYLDAGEYVSLWTGVLTTGACNVVRFSGHAV